MSAELLFATPFLALAATFGIAGVIHFVAFGEWL